MHAGGSAISTDLLYFLCSAAQDTAGRQQTEEKETRTKRMMENSSHTEIIKDEENISEDGLRAALALVNDTLDAADRFEHACRIINFDMETICPEKAMEKQGELAAFMENEGYKLKKAPEFIRAAGLLYEHRGSLPELPRILAESLRREYAKTMNLTAEKNLAFGKIYSKAFADWISAKKNADFSAFAPSLAAVCKAQEETVRLRTEKTANVYDSLLSDYERGMTSRDLDACFAECKARLIPLLREISGAGKKIRTDFLSRPVPDDAQRKMAAYLLQVMDFDFTRGAFTTAEHPFTDGLAIDDARVTTHYYSSNFLSSIFSIIHEGGHALFEQLQPREDITGHISGEKTMGMHESVSRFYENRIGRSEAFIRLIYPKAKELFPEVLSDVTERELYEAVNAVTPSLVRTEADEFTYTFHIIIRYEIEKLLMSGQADTASLPALWNEKYREYLGITPSNDREGVLQDVHWTSGFGYFPTYALGNMYNAMYYRRMQEDLDIDALIAAGDFRTLNRWMAEHVFSIADRMDAKTWIRTITGRDFTADDFLSYLEDKYRKLYNIID